MILNKKKKKTPTGSCQSIVTICLKNWVNMKPPIFLTDPTIKTEKSSQKSHTTDYVDSNEESDRKKALQDGLGSKPRPSFYFFATALIALTAIVVLCTALEKCTLTLVSSPN